jgi:ABC-type multidrug transport system fused ATPase/permease subunit
MKENYFFRPIQEGMEKKKEEINPLTIEEHKEIEQESMMPKDYWASLCLSIQEKKENKENKELLISKEDQERIKSLNELITPELTMEYKQIIERFNKKTEKSEEHVEREFIDINSENLSSNIESWIKNLIDEIKKERELVLEEESAEELRAQCWLLFDSIGNVMNAKSLEKDVKDFYEERVLAEDNRGEQEKQKAELIEDLQSRYPLNRVEIELLVDLIKFEKGKDENYSPKILVETLSRLWNEYNLNEERSKLSKIFMGYLMARAAGSFAPSLFQNIITQDNFRVDVFMEYFVLSEMPNFIDAKANIELEKVMNNINHQINERITNSLFFQEFEFIHEKSLGDIFTTLGNGKKSTELILRDTISRFLPVLAGVGMSIAFLTGINPVLGAIGVGSLPVMYGMAKTQNKKIWSMYKREKKEEKGITTHLGSIKGGSEEVFTSSEIPLIACDTKKQMDKKDDLSTERFAKEIKMKTKSRIPFGASTVIAAAVGGSLQEMGIVSGGEVLANILYSEQLNRPIQELVYLYFNRFARCVQDIEKMEEILGKYEELDLPEGEKEGARVSVSALDGSDISIRNLRYKNILRGINLDIKQGEFLTITGASGSGKTTLLRNLVNLYKSDEGEIKIGGVNHNKIKKYGKESIYSIMSYCNQNPQIFDGKTLRENLLLWSQKEAGDEKIKKILRDLHLEKFIDNLDEKIKNLSGGERVRIGLARTLIKEAKIMLLDEPTASLDSRAATEVRKIIKEINEKYPDTTILCVSHDEELATSSKRSVSMIELQE